MLLLFISFFFLALLFYRGHAKPNETVLIHGASGGVSLRKKKRKLLFDEKVVFLLLVFKVGIAAVQLAKALGLRVIGTASTEQGLQAIRDQGADLVFNHKQEGYLKDIAVGCLCFRNNRSIEIYCRMHVLVTKELILFLKC